MNIEKLKGIIPEQVYNELPEVIQKFNITNNLRLAHFLAQAAHESGGFKWLIENLNYSSEGLKKIFPKYFPGNLNESYARKPEKIASHVYANRMGNGNETSGDGYKYRGRGYIQLTGKSNYKLFSDFINEDCVANPDLIASKYALASAAFYFNKNKIWDICDKGSDSKNIISVTRAVNGGLTGLESRIIYFNKFNKILNG